MQNHAEKLPWRLRRALRRMQRAQARRERYETRGWAVRAESRAWDALVREVDRVLIRGEQDEEARRGDQDA